MAEPRVFLSRLGVDVRFLSPGERAVVEALGELSARVFSLEATIRKGQAPLSARGSSVGQSLTVALNLREVGAVTLEVWVKSSVAATFQVEGSADGSIWRSLDSLSLSAPGEKHQGYMNAYPVVRARTEEIGDHEIEIVAAR